MTRRLSAVVLVLTLPALPAQARPLQSEPPSPPEAAALLEAAAGAILGMRTAVYEARAEVQTASASRVTTGSVRLARLDYSDPIGGRVALEGQERLGHGNAEPFAAAYDGQAVRRIHAAHKKLVQGDVMYGGETLLKSGTGKAILLQELLAEEPLADERKVPGATCRGIEEVEGVPCHVVGVEFGESQAAATWYLGVEDHLPRRVMRQFRSASGKPVTSVLTLSGLRVDTALDDSTFDLEKPEGFTLEVVGRKPAPTLQVGDMVPDFTLVDDQGRMHTLSAYRGRLVLLEFWASWCTYCKKSMPAVQKMQDTYSPRGLAVLAINYREGEQVNPGAFVRNQGYSYPVLLNGSQVEPLFRIGPIPSFYLVGPDGRLVHKEGGFNEEREVRLIEQIEKHLARR